MKAIVAAVVLASLVGAGLLLTALGTTEKGNRRWVFQYDKGTYRGELDQRLSEDALRALRARSAYQAGPTTEGQGVSGASVGLSGSNVRPPGAPAVGLGADQSPLRGEAPAR
jgi:hypothetical protein